MFAQHRLPSLLVALGMTTIVAGLILPQTYMIANAEPAALDDPRSEVLPRLPEYVTQPVPPNVVVSRDPFAGGNGAGVPGERMPSGFLPKDAAAPEPAFPAGLAPSDAVASGAPTLLATAIGRRPCAIVSEAGSIRILRLGDPLAGSTVRSIRLGTLSLAEGSSLRIGAP
jgi:hypothetical protein